MKILNLVQGTDEWKTARAKYFTASEASIMMACSKNVSRNELLKMKAIGTDQEFSDWFQKNILDKGHAVEAEARPIAEAIIGEDLFPVTGLSEDLMLELLASYDGLTMMGDTCWECKQYNADKAASLDAGEMPEVDYWQVVQQMLVSEADKCLYMVTDGTEENTRHIWVAFNEDHAKQLIAGWQQFADDLANYEHKEAKPEAVAEQQADLPSLVVDLVGEVRSTNLATVKDVILARIQAVNTDLKTDNDFATAEATVKFFTKGEKQLEEVKTQALAQTASIDELFKTVDHLKSVMRTKRLSLNKSVKERKEAIRIELVMKAKAALSKFIGDIEKGIGQQFGNQYPVQLPAIQADFAGAMKNKRTITSLESAVDDALAKAKIEANQWDEHITHNLRSITQKGEEFLFLFNDYRQLVLLDQAHLSSEIDLRIINHKAAEEKRLDAEREQIRKQEEARILAEQKEKVQAEQQPAPATIPEQPQSTAEPRFQAPSGRKQSTGEAQLMRPAEAISITPEEYQSLKYDSALLAALMAAGVDSWDGYSEAMNIVKAA